MFGHELFQGCLGDHSVVYWSVKEETLSPRFASVIAKLLGVVKKYSCYQNKQCIIMGYN